MWFELVDVTRTTPGVFRHALEKNPRPLQRHRYHFDPSVCFIFKKKKSTGELLTSIDSTSYFFLLLRHRPITGSPTDCLPLPRSHWDARRGALGSWMPNKRSPCAALFAQRGVLLKRRRFTALPCGSHLRVCACVLVWERCEVCPAAQFVHSSCTFSIA